MFKIIADINTILDLTYDCGANKTCDGCVLRSICDSKGRMFHTMPGVEIDRGGYSEPLNNEGADVE